MDREDVKHIPFITLFMIIVLIVSVTGHHSRHQKAAPFVSREEIEALNADLDPQRDYSNPEPYDGSQEAVPLDQSGINYWGYYLDQIQMLDMVAEANREYYELNWEGSYAEEADNADHAYQATYALVDIDRDGIKELISASDTGITFQTVHEEFATGKVLNLTFSDGTGDPSTYNFYGVFDNPDKGVALIYGSPDNPQKIIVLSKADDSVQQTEVYGEYVYPETYVASMSQEEITDDSKMEKYLSNADMVPMYASNDKSGLPGYNPSIDEIKAKPFRNPSKINYMNVYKPILQKAFMENQTMGGMGTAGYLLFDLSGDGIKELIVVISPNEAESTCDYYTVDPKTGSPYLLFEDGMSHRVFCNSKNGKSLLIDWQFMNGKGIYRVNETGRTDELAYWTSTDMEGAFNEKADDGETMRDDLLGDPLRYAELFDYKPLEEAS